MAHVALGIRDVDCSPALRETLGLAAGWSEVGLGLIYIPYERVYIDMYVYVCICMYMYVVCIYTILPYSLVFLYVRSCRIDMIHNK